LGAAAGFLFDRIAVIEESIDGNHFGERGHAPDVIAVKMRRQQVIDLLQTRLPGRRVDAFCITVVRRTIAGVHEQRLPRRRHDQRCRPAFDIDPVNVQIAGLGG